MAKKKDLIDQAAAGAKSSALPAGLSAAGSVGMSAMMGVAPHLVLPLAAASALGTTTVNTLSHMIKEKNKEKEQEKKARISIGANQRDVLVDTPEEATQLRALLGKHEPIDAYISMRTKQDNPKRFAQFSHDDLAAASKMARQKGKTAFDQAFTKRAQEYGLTLRESERLLQQTYLQQS